MDKEREHFLKVATEAAYAGGAVLRQYWGELTKVRDKSAPGDLVTEADEASEKAIVEILHRNFPSHGILAEESGELGNQDSSHIWIVDPLDGTTNYAHQFPFCAVSIALQVSGQLDVAAVLDPFLNELYQAIRGQGATCNGEAIAVSQAASVEKSLLATGFPYKRSMIKDNNYAEFCHMTDICQGIRRPGAAALDMAYVACGRLEGFWERQLKPWDIAAGALLVIEAGGKITAYDGSPLDLEQGEVLATNGLIHECMIHELLTVRSQRNQK